MTCSISEKELVTALQRTNLTTFPCKFYQHPDKVNNSLKQHAVLSFVAHSRTSI
jgi:hypothetical protein